MELKTRDFGIVEVESDAVYNFPEGLYGFEQNKEFAVFEQTFEEVSFLYLQSTETSGLCFLVFEPWELYEGYSPDLSPEDFKALETNDTEDLIFLVIANVSDSIENLSLNIKSPVAMNPKTKKARQIILQNQSYPIRFKPFCQGGKDGAQC